MLSKMWKWIYDSNEDFWNIVIFFAVLLTCIALPILSGYFVWWLSGSGLLTFIAVIVPIALLGVTTAAHVGHEKGIRGWWQERPWKKMERV